MLKVLFSFTGFDSSVTVSPTCVASKILSPWTVPPSSPGHANLARVCRLHFQV